MTYLRYDGFRFQNPARYSWRLIHWLTFIRNIHTLSDQDAHSIMLVPSASHQGAQRTDGYIHGVLDIERRQKADFMSYIEGIFVERAPGPCEWHSVEVPLFAKELREEWMIEEDSRVRI